MEQFMQLYGLKIWSFRTYSGYESKIRNYVNPYIGDMLVKDVNALTLDMFYDKLQKQKAVGRKGEKNSYTVTTKTICEIHKCLRCAFNQAVAWEIIAKNPCNNAKPPKYAPSEKKILDSDEIVKIIQLSEDLNLTVALHLGFACTMRIGEILGLTWDCVDVSDEALDSDSCNLLVNKELQRVEIEHLDKLKANEILFKFPNIMHNSKSILILKSPKTESSARKIWIPKTAAESLRELKKEQEDRKFLLSEIYTDYNMVIASNAGHPVEHRNIHKALHSLTDAHGIPRIVFHSLRHSSTTAKLKLMNGDLKATQGDTGHADATMIMDLYAHIMDKDRVETARKFEREIYGKNQPGKAENNALDIQKLLQEALASPEIVSALTQLVMAQKC
jgi:integrase